jgi:hypothetical protein
MKKIFVFILLSASLKGAGQNKPAWELIFKILGIANSSPANKPIQSVSGYRTGTPVGFLVDSAGNPLYLPSNIYSSYLQNANKVQYSSKLTAGFCFGGRLMYSLNKNFDLSIGGTISLMNVSRTANNTASSFLGGLSPADSIFGSTLSGGQMFIGTAGSFFSSVYHQTETFRFSTFNMPINLIYKKSKWRFEAGFTPSFIVHSSKKKNAGNSNSEMSVTDVPFENNQKIATGLNLGCNFAFTKTISAGVEYVQGISTLVDADNYRRLLPRSISLQLLYKL